MNNMLAIKARNNTLVIAFWSAGPGNIGNVKKTHEREDNITCVTIYYSILVEYVVNRYMVNRQVGVTTPVVSGDRPGLPRCLSPLTRPDPTAAQENDNFI